MTTTTEQSSATTRKTTAAAALRQLKDERETIATRQKSAQQVIEQTNKDIVLAERSGEPDRLRELRDDRRIAEESARDLERTLPTVAREIELAEGELHMAERACQAEDWNRCQVEQVALLRTIEESVNTIVSAIANKEKLAHVQQKILANVCPGADQNPDRIRHDLAHAITARLQVMAPTTLRTVDWTCLRMTEQGDLR